MFISNRPRYEDNNNVSERLKKILWSKKRERLRAEMKGDTEDKKQAGIFLSPAPSVFKVHACQSNFF